MSWLSGFLVLVLMDGVRILLTFVIITILVVITSWAVRFWINAVKSIIEDRKHRK